MLISALAIATAIALWLVPGAHASPDTAQTATDAGCDTNGLPNSLALCDGAGRVTIKLKGNAVLSVGDGWVGLSGKAKTIRKRMKNGKVRKIRRKPIVPAVDTFRRGKYTVYTGDQMYFYLPPGNWRVVVNGVGLSVSAVGDGHVNLRAKPVRPRDPEPPPAPGLVSIAGSDYVDWPDIWRFFRFGENVPTPDIASIIDGLRTREGSVSDHVGDQ